LGEKNFGKVYGGGGGGLRRPWQVDEVITSDGTRTSQAKKRGSSSGGKKERLDHEGSKDGSSSKKQTRTQPKCTAWSEKNTVLLSFMGGFGGKSWICSKKGGGFRKEEPSRSPVTAQRRKTACLRRNVWRIGKGGGKNGLAGGFPRTKGEVELLQGIHDSKRGGGGGD